MALPISTLSALPEAPSLSDPANFQDEAAAFVAALATLRSEVNTIAGEINGGLATAVIVGAVSQSGGSPTGAIIEQDSNANGSYTQWADGTMICVREVEHDLSDAAGQNWDYASAFASQPYGGIIGIDPNNLNNVTQDIIDSQLLGWTQGAGNWRTRGRLATGTETITIHLGAIGRWF